MKFLKHLVVLTILLCAIPTLSHAAGTVQAVGGGSSAIYLELGQGAQSAAATSTPCVWSLGKNAAITAGDNRPATAVNEQGNIWLTWKPVPGTCAAPVAPYNIKPSLQLAC